MLKSTTNPQIALNLNIHDDATFDNFFILKKNQPLLTNLHTMAKGRGEHFIYFWGNHASGKTHLLQACCHTSNQLKLKTFYLSLKNLKNLRPAVLDYLESMHLICIDDIDSIAAQPAWEKAFLHFFNRVHDAGKRLIIAGNKAPNTLGIELPDLVSRLSWGIVFQLYELTDEEKIHALILRFKARGLLLSEKVANFLFYRCQRDMKTLFSMLEKLDQASFQAQHKLTIPFVKSVLGL